MGYDLHFKSRDNNFTFDTFVNFFLQRYNYHLKDNELLYENETTGVYFYFEYNDVHDEPDDEYYDVAFSINYMRPHIFALEAAIELQAFVDQFNFILIDYQIDGMEVFTSEEFIKQWEKGNDISLYSVPDHLKKEFIFMPRHLIENVWRWNYNIDQTVLDYAEKGINIIVPKIYLIIADEQLFTMVTWYNAEPILIPKDMDLIFLDFPDNKLGISRVVKAEDIDGILKDYEIINKGLDCYFVDFTSTPDNIIKYLQEVQGQVYSEFFIAPLERTITAKSEDSSLS